MEEIKPLEEGQIHEPCPVCASGISSGERTVECDWCGAILHEDCEPKQDRCPTCRRFLPTAKMKALASDRRFTAVLLVIPFVIIEAIIAVYSWLTHPSVLSVPDIDNWLSVGLIVNVLLLVLALVTMGVAAKKGEGLQKRTIK